MAFKLETEQFSGPLEVLLDMIQKRKLPINDISLSQITDEYLSYVQGIDKSHFGDVTYFLVVASTLMLIKSKSLLPTIDLTEDEEDSIMDLERRLKTLQVYQRHMDSLNDRITNNKRLYFGTGERAKRVFAPDKKVTSQVLLNSIREVLSMVPKPVINPEVRVRTVIHIEDMMQSLEDRLRTALKTSFRDLTKPSDGMTSAEAKTHAVVGFIAMLEMVKNGLCDVMQDEHYSDIAIERV
ncbi:MAG: segregation/condensation protein A [Candidatus Nomurabacteria bacterium]|nr:segregation/condensation protein A [Candidatus Nomurabacteria bacterium]